MYSYSNQALSFGGVIKACWRAYLCTFKSLALLAVLMSVILLAPMLFVTIADLPEEVIQAYADSPWFFVYVLLAAILSLAVAIYMLMIADSQLRGTRRVLDDVHDTAKSRFIPAVLAFLIYLVAYVVGSILLVIPAIIVWVFCFFFMPAVVIDNHGPWQGIKQSCRLVWGNWWRTLGLLIVLKLCMGVAMLVLSLLTMFLLFLLDFPLGNWGTVVNIIEAACYLAIGTMVAPFEINIQLILYKDLKLRKESQRQRPEAHKSAEKIVSSPDDVA